MSNQKIEVFKYFRLNENFIDNIKNRSIFASSREQLNDPFDILSFIKVDGRKTRYQSMIQVVKKKYPNAFKDTPESNEYLHKVIKDKKIDLNNLLKKYDSSIDPNEYFKYLAGKMKIVSFSKVNNSNLMWAHYADGFKGLMVKYEISPSVFEYENLVNVSYKFKNQELNSLEDVIKYIFGYKLIDWEYEAECRIVIDRSGQMVYDHKGKKEIEKVLFKNHKIKEIYFGARFDKNGKEILIECKDELRKYDDVCYYSSILNEQELRIDNKKIDFEHYFRELLDLKDK